LAIVLKTGEFFCTIPLADDLADLKAAHQSLNKAWNTGDMKTFFEIWQDGGIWLPPSQAFPIVTNSAMGMQWFCFLNG